MLSPVAQRFFFNVHGSRGVPGVGAGMWTVALGQAKALPFLPQEVQAIILDFVRQSTLPALKHRLFARVHEELKLYPFGTGFR